jgi:hypothetical protein
MFGSERNPHRKAQIRQRIAPAVDRLVARAHEQGTLRDDIVGIDIPMIQIMVAAITDNTGVPDAWRRYLRLLIDGLRARPGATTLPPSQNPTKHSSTPSTTPAPHKPIPVSAAARKLARSDMNGLAD